MKKFGLTQSAAVRNDKFQFRSLFLRAWDLADDGVDRVMGWMPHALCFANDDVYNYLKALCRDLATNYPMWGIQLESFGWMSFNHGHHHERDLVGLTSLEQQLMGLCVCEA
jgi:hypothetical protein